MHPGTISSGVSNQSENTLAMGCWNAIWEGVASYWVDRWSAGSLYEILIDVERGRVGGRKGWGVWYGWGRGRGGCLTGEVEGFENTGEGNRWGDRRWEKGRRENVWFGLF